MELKVHVARSFFRDLYLEAHGVALGRYTDPRKVRLLPGDVLYAVRSMKRRLETEADTDQYPGCILTFFSSPDVWSNSTSIFKALIDLCSLAADDPIFEDRRLSHIEELAPALISAALGMPIATRVKLLMSLERMKNGSFKRIRGMVSWVSECFSDLVLFLFGVTREEKNALRMAIQDGEVEVLEGLSCGESAARVTALIQRAVDKCYCIVTANNWIARGHLNSAVLELLSIQQLLPNIVRHRASIGKFIEQVASQHSTPQLCAKFRRFDVTTQCYLLKKIFPIVRGASSLLDPFRTFFREMLRNERQQRVDLLITALLNNNWGMQGLPLWEVHRLLVPPKNAK